MGRRIINCINWIKDSETGCDANFRICLMVVVVTVNSAENNETGNVGFSTLIIIDTMNLLIIYLWWIITF